MKMLDKYLKGGVNKNEVSEKAPEKESRTRKRFNKKFKKARDAGKETFKFRQKQFNLLEKRKKYTTETADDISKKTELNKHIAPNPHTNVSDSPADDPVPSPRERKKQKEKKDNIRKYVDGGTDPKPKKEKETPTPENKKETPIKLDTIKPTTVTPESNKEVKKLPENTNKVVESDKNDNTSSNNDVTLKPSERFKYRLNMSKKDQEKQSAKEQKIAQANRDKEGDQMTQMTDKQRKRYARNEARNERKIERGQMRLGRKENRKFLQTKRRAAREDAREARGMTYTGGRRISPRRWYKNLKDKLGLRVNRGEGRLKSGPDFKRHTTSPSYYNNEGGDAMQNRGDRKGRYRSNEGTFDPTARGSGQRYKGSRKGLQKFNDSIGDVDENDNILLPNSGDNYEANSEGDKILKVKDSDKEMKRGGISKKYENGGSTDKYGKRHARLRKKGHRLQDKSMDPKNDGNDKRFNRQADRAKKALDKARDIRHSQGYKYDKGGNVPPGMGKYNQGGELEVYDNGLVKPGQEKMNKGGLTRKMGKRVEKKIRVLTRQEKLDRKRNLNYRPQSAGPRTIPSRRLKQDREKIPSRRLQQDREKARALAPVKKERKNKKAMMGMIAKAAMGAMGK